VTSTLIDLNFQETVRDEQTLKREGTSSLKVHAAYVTAPAVKTVGRLIIGDILRHSYYNIAKEELRKAASNLLGDNPESFGQCFIKARTGTIDICDIMGMDLMPTLI
jgi:hypothetical protein